MNDVDISLLVYQTVPPRQLCRFSSRHCFLVKTPPFREAYWLILKGNPTGRELGGLETAGISLPEELLEGFELSIKPRLKLERVQSRPHLP